MIPLNNFIFYMIAARQVCAYCARPIFNCAPRMGFEQGPRVHQVALFLVMGMARTMPLRSVLRTEQLNKVITYHSANYNRA